MQNISLNWHLIYKIKKWLFHLYTEDSNVSYFWSANIHLNPKTHPNQKLKINMLKYNFISYCLTSISFL